MQHYGIQRYRNLKQLHQYRWYHHEQLLKQVFLDVTVVLARYVTFERFYNVEIILYVFKEVNLKISKFKPNDVELISNFTTPS